MRDVHCGQCGEPWGVYALNNDIEDITGNDPDAPENPGEYIKHGKGCPCCDWGEKAGEVSLSRTESADEIEARRLSSLMDVGEDPVKYL